MVCNNCGGDKYTDFLKLPVAGTTDEYKASAFRANGEQLVKCNTCGLVFIDPFPHEDEKIVDDYATAIDDEYVSQMDYRMKTFGKVLNKLEKITGLKEGRVLDIGCAAGAFVKVAKDRGWQACGIEPCGYLVKWGINKLGLDTLYTGTLDESKLDGCYNMITMFDVLEHVPDPDNTIYLIKNLLCDDGYFVTNLPDISHPIPKLMGARWPFYASCHLYYYTPETIDHLMSRHGFERVHMSGHWQELSLGYLAYRFEQFIPAISKIGVKVLNALGLSEIPIKYNIGQTLFVYKKKNG